ncbi:MAG TPA: outer membrane protein assembly factor BamA [Acidiferrobacterales bacterium]|nr:outer membrane protein assembly factor BamA [Acidiferrobacterales bacterium]
MKFFFAVAFLYALSVSLVFAIEPFVVKDIRVEGLQRTEPGTVFNYLPIKVGDRVTEASAQEAIRALFKTGFFNDVRLERKDDVLIVIVDERPSIDSIKIIGAKDIDEATIKKSLKEIGLAEGRVFNTSILDKVEQELKRQYFNRGRYAIKVKPTVTPLERNRVAIKIDISEGMITKIQQINIVGNRAFSNKELLRTFTLSTPTMFSFLTKNDQYSKQKLASDLESLRSFYQNRGYLEFNIASTQVSITPDKQSIYLTINLTEGKKYTVSGYKLVGKLVVDEQELRNLIRLKPGDVFSRQVLTDSSKKITDRLGNEGYAFANVNAIPEIDKQKQTVAFTLFVDPGQRVYVRRVNFSGNTVTHDEVLRREMRQFEGAWYSGAKIQRSVERLRRVGFFDEVTVETPAVPGSPDQVDVNITVKERPTGTFTAGIGYSDVDGLLLNASVNFKNFLGTGKEVGARIDNSSFNKIINLSYINPYYTPDGVSRAFNIFSSKINAAAVNIASYNSTTEGASVSYNIPISEDRSINLGVGYESVHLDVTSTSAQIAQDFVAEHGDTNQVVKATLGWARDTLNSRIFPTQGTLQQVSGEISVPGSNLEYYRLIYVAGLYHPLSSDYTLKLRGELGYGDGYGKTPELPFYKNFYAGGSNSVRGYRGRSLGPKDTLPPNDPIGGSTRVLGNTEILFPFPGARENKSLRLSVFVDAGMVYAPSERVDLGGLRYSTGLAANYFSPIGPISLSWARPLNAKEGDSIDRLQFTLGVAFQ